MNTSARPVIALPWLLFMLFSVAFSASVNVNLNTRYQFAVTDRET